MFTRLGDQDFAACLYHRADDWKAITAAVLAFARAEPDSDEQDRLYHATHLSGATAPGLAPSSEGATSGGTPASRT
ncbi:hypothetical protein [Streptomyces alfalfae]